MEVYNGKVIACAQTSNEREEFLKTLPKLSLAEVPPDESCPICLSLFSAILEEECAGISTAPKEQLGITRLQCGHIFCMFDITVWIHTSRGSCPTCRDLFLIFPEPSDDESSDGGEYIPGSDSAADEMMDYDTWTDEGEFWTDGEEMFHDGEITEIDNDSDTSWERSSEDEGGIPTPSRLEQPRGDSTVINNAEHESYLTFPDADLECEQIKAELSQWKAQIEPIQMHEWLSNGEEIHTKINEGMRVLEELKPRIDSIERDTSEKASFVNSALATVREVRALMELKLGMMQHYVLKQKYTTLG